MIKAKMRQHSEHFRTREELSEVSLTGEGQNAAEWNKVVGAMIDGWGQKDKRIESYPSHSERPRGEQVLLFCGDRLAARIIRARSDNEPHQIFVRSGTEGHSVVLENVQRHGGRI